MTPSLPPELWRCVLRFATWDGIDYDAGMPGISKGTPREDNMKTKVAVTLVSRLFHHAASAFLFEHIIIEDARRAQKLSALLSTLGQEGARHWIKVIVVDIGKKLTACRSPTGGVVPMVANTLRLCLNLQGFIWLRPTHGTEFTKRDDVQKMIAHIPGTIQICRWVADIQCVPFGAFLLRASASLRVLILTGFNTCDCSAHMSITFPSLTHLTLTVDSDGTSESHSFLGPTPSLTELTLLGEDYNIISEILTLERTRMLRILRFGRETEIKAAILALALRACPLLQEVHYHSHNAHPSSTPWKGDVNHPTLRHLSVTGMGWDYYADLESARARLRLYFCNISASRFPLLHTITFDGVLLPESEFR
ncbi:hypothetical protein BD410DRAFT_622495 [Rickenella mellea]|uniref:F-box domain-containing protein n=1 Tax=Rickenella mellea TaxID=50990 RepID=A0A4Y7PMS4_9AGAM|nr:hypothetical protein BD410DRAFT_622495 [Rickenella mellea]